MAERATVAQVTQIGVESTSGTAVPANKLLASLEITGGIKAQNKKFRPQGRKYSSFVIPGREWSEYKLGGMVTYGEVVYPLSSILKATTPSSDTTLGKKWVFAPALSAEDTVKTFTLEQGSAVRAHSAAYGVVTELGFKFTRDGVEYDGAMIAQRITDGVTLTAAPTAIETPVVPIAGTQISVAFADTWAGLEGATAATRVLEANWKIGDRFNPLWVLDASKASFVATVETVPSIAASVTLEADAEGMAFLDLMRNATMKWMRISATGPDIETGKPYLFQIDGAYNVSEPTEFKDQDGVYAVGWTLEPVYDATATKTYEVTVRNKVATL